MLSAPSGTGKTTLSRMLLDNDEYLSLSISCTTRPPREGEVDGRDYYFVTRESFQEMVRGGQMLEYAEILGNYYGTPKKVVEKRLENGKDVLFDIDWQGHMQLISRARSDVASVFMLPPSKSELFSRLTNRPGSEVIDVMRRIEHANLEVSHWHEYDYVIINKELDKSLQKLLMILHSERLKKERRIGLPALVTEFLQSSCSESDDSSNTDECG